MGTAMATTVRLSQTVSTTKLTVAMIGAMTAPWSRASQYRPFARGRNQRFHHTAVGSLCHSGGVMGASPEKRKRAISNAPAYRDSKRVRESTKMPTTKTSRLAAPETSDVRIALTAIAMRNVGTR